MGIRLQQGLLAGSGLASLLLADMAFGQTVLPEIEVAAPKAVPAKPAPPRRVRGVRAFPAAPAPRVAAQPSSRRRDAPPPVG